MYKEQCFQNVALEQFILYAKKNEHRLRPQTLHKNKLKMSQRHEYKMQTDKTCRKKEKNLCDLGFGYDFIQTTAKHDSLKRKG